jgi:hypothetical protein
MTTHANATRPPSTAEPAVELFSLFPALRVLTPPIQAGYLSVEISFILRPAVAGAAAA